MRQQQKQYFSASELAGLPGLPSTKRRVNALALREAWPARDRAGRGGGREYPFAALPVEARDALARSLLGGATAEPQSGSTALLNEPQTTAAPAILPAPSALHDWQRRRGEARAAILAEVKRLGAQVGITRALRAVAQSAQEGTLPAHLQRLVPVANARTGKSATRTLSRASLFRWMKDSSKGFAALAPKPSKKEHDAPEWLAALLAIRQQPSRPSLPYCLEKLGKQLGIKPPPETTARFWLNKLSAVDLARGRMGPRALKSIRPYVKRGTAHMWPGDCYTADGHTFDAEIAHPKHGQPFRPEITSVLDIATRRAVGWSVNLSESTWAVLDAQRNAFETAGICALWYVDRGSGYFNAMQEDLVTGAAARTGFTITHSLPWNSQARGIEERSHRSIWVRAAKELPTYMGADMDREARQNVYKLTRRDLKQTGASRLLMPWREFLVFVQTQIDAYNDRPHKGLPKIRDAVSGKQRHMTPNEAWQQALDEGWEPVRVEAHEAEDMFRPYQICTVRRGMVQLHNNSYFNAALADYHGEKVQVGYDIHDAGRVWVRDASRRLICVAEFEANKRDYFPQAVIDQAAEKRAKGRIARAALRIEEAEAELRPAALLEHAPGDFLEDVMPQLERAEVADANENAAENVVALSGMRRPSFDTDPEKYRWLLAHEGEIDKEDRGWIAWYEDTEEWFDLFGVGARREAEEEF